MNISFIYILIVIPVMLLMILFSKALNRYLFLSHIGIFNNFSNYNNLPRFFLGCLFYCIEASEKSYLEINIKDDNLE